jgi:hypothetical protein
MAKHCSTTPYIVEDQQSKGNLNITYRQEVPRVAAILASKKDGNLSPSALDRPADITQQSTLFCRGA